METHSPQEYVAMHKTAFREAFNFLSAHFPPVHDSGWWEKSMKEMAELDAEHPGNTLLRELLLGVTGYLEKESRMRKKEETHEG